MARLALNNAAMRIGLTPDGNFARVGTRCDLVSPVPSAPVELSPHAYRRWSDPIARLWYPPAATCTGFTPLGRLMTFGRVRSLAVPSPTCPETLEPQA